MAVLTIASLVLLILVAISVGLVCSSSKCELCTTPQCIQTSASILGAMNLSVDPCEDFYEYSCGTWLDKVDLPDGHSRWGSFGEVDLENKRVLRKLLGKDDNTYKGKSSTSIRKALDFYTACIDKVHQEKEGIKPMLKYIKELGGWSLLASDTELGNWDEAKEWDITDEILNNHQHFSNALFSMWIGVDDRNSNAYIIQFQQSGLGLGPPDVYLDKERDIEDAYIVLGAKIATYLSLANEKDETELGEEAIFTAAEGRMDAILAVELALAKIFVPKEELQDPVKTYHKMELKEFAASIPEINFMKYMETIFGKKIPETEEVVVYTPSYFEKLSKLLKDIKMRDLVEYMRWLAIKPMLRELNQAIIEITLQFLKVADGTDEDTPRWQKCISKTTGTLGFATGALFVKEKVTPEIKNQTHAMISHIRKAFLDNLKDLKWMDDETKTHAEEKAEDVIEMIGYPDWLEDPAELDKYYEKMTISKVDSFDNNLNSKKFYVNKNLARLNQKVDRNEWEMSPGEVNAYYSPSFNQIVFPSGILQYPFYDFNAPSAVNYGAAGLVMGHELTHGFDNQGRKYDQKGNVVDWWLNATSQAYEEKTKCMISQYSQYKVGDPKLNLTNNGKLTLGENIADNSGGRIAFQAFKEWDKAHPDNRQLPGLTDFSKEQLFYIGFSRVWCNLQTPQSEKMSVYSDVHTNAKYRVIGVVSNSEEFAKAFKCPKGSPMNPKEKCTIF
ncbi:endothelin-converting enzyme homolog isoform X2 [Amphiura filiformis]